MRKTSDVDLSRKVGGRYTLVIAAAKRAKQLNEGSRALVQGDSDNTVAIALDEISQGKIKVISAEYPEDGG